MAMTQEESKQISRAIYEKLGSTDPVMVKQAVDAVKDFTRTKVREDGFYRRIMPMQQVTDDDLDRTVESSKPSMVIDLEPDSPAAVSIPFATLPTSLWMQADRYLVTFERIATVKYTKDVAELRTWIMDIRQVLSDNAIRDMLAEEDGKFLQAVNYGLVGPDMIVPQSGVAQYRVISGGITRDSLWDSLMIMPSTPSNLENHTVLLNNITIKHVGKFGRDEMGGNLSEDIMKSGLSIQNDLMGLKWIVTIKKGLVPNLSLFYFGDPRYIGKSFILEDTQMYIRREAYMLEFFAYEEIGGAIGHTGALARVDFE